MATVDKNFRIKNGLVVEGSTATVNGNDILAKNTQDGDSYIINLIGGTATPENTANTVVKRDANGNFAAGIITANIVGNVTGTVSDISNHSTSSLSEGTNLYFTNQRAIDAGDGVFDGFGAASAAQAAAEATAALDATSKANAARAAAEATAALDATSKANAAQAAANSYTDGRETAITTAYEAYADQAEVDAKAYTDAREIAITSAYESYADTAETDAKAYTDARETAITTASQSYADTAADGALLGANTYTDNREIAITMAYESYADQAEVDAKAYADQKVADLVDSAPALLDTLNELAAAIGDNPNYATDLATSVGEKVAKAGDTMTGLLVLSADPSANLGAATKQYVDAAADGALASANIYTDNRETAITTAYEAYADQAEVDAIATAQAALDDVLDATTPFTDLNINDVAKQVAARTTSLGSVVVTAYQFNKTNFKSGKFLVKIDNGTHNEISEILVTLDSADNVAITEYAIVGTNGSRGTITADVDGTHCRIRVNPVNDSTITVSGTVFNA